MIVANLYVLNSAGLMSVNIEVSDIDECVLVLLSFLCTIISYTVERNDRENN